jgi:hypothetical protein
MLTGRERLILCGSAREQMVTTAIFSVRPAAWSTPHGDVARGVLRRES